MVENMPLEDGRNCKCGSIDNIMYSLATMRQKINVFETWNLNCQPPGLWPCVFCCGRQLQCMAPGECTDILQLRTPSLYEISLNTDDDFSTDSESLFVISGGYFKRLPQTGNSVNDSCWLGMSIDCTHAASFYANFVDNTFGLSTLISIQNPFV